MRYLIVFLTLFISATAFAADSQHRIGFNVGQNIIDTDLAVEDDVALTDVGLFYEYGFSQHFSLSAGYYQSIAETCFIACSDDDYPDREAAFDSMQLSIKGRVPLGRVFSLYGRAGANWYSLEYTGVDYFGDSVQIDRKDSGVKPALAAGVEFKSNLGINVGYEFQWLALETADSKNHSFFISYGF